MLRLVFFLAAMIAIPLSAMGAVYSYVDEQGVYHFANTRPPAGKGYHILIGDREGDDRAVPSAAVLRNTTYDRLIRHHSEANGLDYRLVKAVMLAESKGNPTAVSHKGARGLMQIMPETGEELALRNPFDPEENIRAGTRYLRLLYELFKGDLELVLAAYNAGPQKVMERMAVPPINETISYIKRVKLYYGKLKETQ
jgi:soluble lytic murein transglycosylase